ncbi:MAG: lysozyme inhibitor LprI family protein [Pelosinus sp.]|nr:lysozyme inhibitor LprI family protein [Pelosinus sp.]
MSRLMRAFRILLLVCILSIVGGTASAEYGIYQYSNDFLSAVKDNPLDRDYQMECTAAQTTINYGELERKYITLWDRELNVVYNKLLAKLTDEQKDLLIESQVGWLNWHLNETKFVDKTILADRKRGSQGPIQEIRAQKQRLRDRTLELMEYYYMLGGKVEFEYQ